MTRTHEIVLDFPGKNAISTQTMTFLEEQLDAAAGRPVLLTGAGDAFSAGLNLKEVAGLDARAMEAFLTRLERVCAKLFDHPAPTVALVNGHAIAGGCIFTICCDVRIGVAGERTRIGLNEVALGLRFPPVIMRIVRARVPPRSISEVVLGAGLYSPAEALRHGLIDEVAPDAETGAARARARLAELAAFPADAYAAAKEELRRDVTRATPEEQARFREAALPIWTGDAIKARIRTVLAGK
jgi:enoyl-CoA hydratase/carnithine racemase